MEEEIKKLREQNNLLKENNEINNKNFMNNIITMLVFKYFIKLLFRLKRKKLNPMIHK